MRRGPFDRFQEISRNFKWAEANVALHSKAGYLPGVRGGLEGPEHLAQRCLAGYYERNTSIRGSRVRRTDLTLGIDSERMTANPQLKSRHYYMDSPTVVQETSRAGEV